MTAGPSGTGSPEQKADRPGKDGSGAGSAGLPGTGGRKDGTAPGTGTGTGTGAGSSAGPSGSPGGSEGGSGTVTSPPTASTSEVQGNRSGAGTFADHHDASGPGPRIDHLARVEAACKVYDPTIESASPGGYWYLIASPPWNGRYYAVANTFLNGDPAEGPYHHHFDPAVPDCPAPPAGDGAP
ncbi:hypothetical protein ACFWNR_06945 [Streptomyces virginiae]|uniref:hypothetical protein n=1 Tax=Streptomyces virginiae TaxID=1961 RepID=UPI003650D5E6